MAVETLRNFIGGEWVPSTGTETLDVTNSATGEAIARTPMSTHEDIDSAVNAATAAFKTWRKVPPAQRARFLFKYKQLLEENFDELATLVTLEHGKTLKESQGSVRRGIENVEHACGIPTLMMGDTVEDVATGIDCESFTQPLGVFAAITPFNFPAMVPLWFWPYAVATGNTYIVKPSEHVPLCQQRLFELAHEAGFPPGVLNMVHGGKAAVEGILDHPGIAGVSFVGSSPIAKLVYRRAAEVGKRVQALGGAKNHIVVAPDADIDRAASIAADSCYGCSGQRCLAGSTVVAVGDSYEPLKAALLEKANAIVLGNGAKEGVTMGPVVTAAHKEKILGYIQKGVDEGAKLILDGRDATVAGDPNGYWLGPSIFDGVTSEMSISKEEIFGPVLVIRRADTLEEAIAMIHESEYANATSIITQSGKTARDFRYDVGVSMIGVNIGVAAPMAFFPFGGTKGSFFGDTKAHGKDSIRFFTDQKVVISRWG